MRKLLILAMFLVSTVATWAQQSPVQWKYRAEKVNDSEYNLIAEADIQDGWFVYSQYLESDDGPVRTTFDFSTTKTISLVGKNEESGNVKKMYDAVFGMNLIKFSKKAVFTQKVKLTAPTTAIKGSVEFMCCDDGVCLPPKSVPFTINL